MKAILLIGHGSRSSEPDEILKVAKLVDKVFPLVEVCFLGLEKPDLNDGIQKCIASGADTIVVIPYFLHKGVHVKSDLPRIINEQKIPGVKIILGEHLGFHEKLAEIVIQRAEEACG